MSRLKHVEYEQSKLIDRIKWNFKPDGKVECCPHCGSDEFYKKLTFTGSSEENFRFDGAIADNGSIHDGVNYNSQKTIYCRDCDRKLGVEVKAK